MTWLDSVARARYALTDRFRRRRFEFFWNTLGQAASAGWWLDLGGGPGSFLLANVKALAERTQQPPPNVILLDVGEEELRAAQRHHPRTQLVCADGEHLPFRAQAFDLIFCNSVIEHVANPSALAREIRRTARLYFVQTPNGAFPLESHSRVPLPFYRWLPRPLQRWLCRQVGASYSYLASVNYLSEATLHSYFPQARIVRERAWGLTKSFYVLGPSETPSPGNALTPQHRAAVDA